MKTLSEKLVDIYMRRGNIVVGVDFDDTIFPSEQGDSALCSDVVDALQRLPKECIICLYSVASPAVMRYKAEIMRLMGIAPDYINVSPLDTLFPGTGKPFFNILLDDKAGLTEALNHLIDFTSAIEAKENVG